MRTGLGKWGVPSGERRKSYNTVGKTHPRRRTCGDHPPEPTRFHSQSTRNSICGKEHLNQAEVE